MHTFTVSISLIILAYLGCFTHYPLAIGQSTPPENLQEPRFTRCPHFHGPCSPHEPECLPGARIYCEAVLVPCRLVPIFITKSCNFTRSFVFWAVGYVLYHSAKNSSMTQYFASHVLNIAGHDVNTTRIKNIHHNSYIRSIPSYTGRSDKR